MIGGEHMADNRKYYYLKLKEGFFESEEIKILESMKDGYIYSNILLKLYLRSLRNEGRLMYRNVIPYTPEILATLVGHQVGTVEKALDVFRKLELIEVLDNGAIYMMDIQNYIGRSSTEADRQRAYYNKVHTEKLLLEGKLEEGKEEPGKTPEPKEEPEEPSPKPKKETTVQIFERLLPGYDISEYLSEKLLTWMEYKTERKEGYKEQGMKSLLTQIVKKSKQYGDDAVRDLIDECMASNWKGIIWDKLANQRTKYGNNAERIENRVSEVDNW